MAYTLRQTDAFANWFSRLRDRTVRARILARLARAENGNFGDVKTVDGALKEFRMPFGGGIRIYHVIHDGQIILLLHGGNISTQARDIERAKRLLAEELSNE